MFRVKPLFSNQKLIQTIYFNLENNIVEMSLYILCNNCIKRGVYLLSIVNLSHTMTQTEKYLTRTQFF